MPPEETTQAPDATNISSSSSAKPSYPTLVDIKKQIPSEFFQASVAVSLYYVARSAVLVTLSAVVALALTLPASPYCLQDWRIRVRDSLPPPPLAHAREPSLVSIRALCSTHRLVRSTIFGCHR